MGGLLQWTTPPLRVGGLLQWTTPPTALHCTNALTFRDDGHGHVVLEYHECVASVHAGIVAPCHDA